MVLHTNLWVSYVKFQSGLWRKKRGYRAVWAMKAFCAWVDTYFCPRAAKKDVEFISHANQKIATVQKAVVLSLKQRWSCEVWNALQKRRFGWSTLLLLPAGRGILQLFSRKSPTWAQSTAAEGHYSPASLHPPFTVFPPSVTHRRLQVFIFSPKLLSNPIRVPHQRHRRSEGCAHVESMKIDFCWWSSRTHHFSTVVCVCVCVPIHRYGYLKLVQV